MSSEVKRRNILFVSHVSSKKYGGAERVLDNLVCGFNRERFKTVLLLQEVVDKNDGLDWDCSSSTEIEYFNFGTLDHGSKILAILGMMFRIVKGCFRIGYLIKRHDIDVVCANSLIAGVFSAVPARMFGKRFFYYEHNIADQRKGHLIGLALQPVARLATDIICISNSVKESLEREAIPASKLHLIYNGYDFQSLNIVSSGKLPARHKEDVVRVGMVANFIPWKRHLLFLELMDGLGNAIPDIKIEATLVGGCLPGSENYYQKIVDWVEAYQGNVDFVLTGFQDNVADYFRSFDILINPAKAEPFGLIFIEAMYLGCVVVGSIDGAAPEIIDDGVTGFVVDYDDTNFVLQRLTELASNAKVRVNIGQNASLIVREKFSIEKQVQQIENLFTTVS
ncbi:MAG: glycosyltransferase family 4 protein [Methylococcaceae bacterium]|nr:glycosyltransferase family 4 protein [Methylococcaceae bacterium]